MSNPAGYWCGFGGRTISNVSSNSVSVETIGTTIYSATTITDMLSFPSPRILLNTSAQQASTLTGTNLTFGGDSSIVFDIDTTGEGARKTSTKTQTINNSNKTGVDIKPNTNYYLRVLVGNAFNEPAVVYSGTTAISDWYNSSYSSLGIEGCYVWLFSGTGDLVKTLPKQYASVVIDSASLNSFKSLKEGQSGNLKITCTIGDGIANGHAIGATKMALYARFKYANESVWSSWQKLTLNFPDGAELDQYISNGFSHTGTIKGIVAKSGSALQIEATYGSTSSEYASSVYENYFFLAPPKRVEQTISFREDNGELQSLDTPDYRIEIWNSRTANRGSKYKMIEYLESRYDAAYVYLPIAAEPKCVVEIECNFMSTPYEPQSNHFLFGNLNLSLGCTNGHPFVAVKDSYGSTQSYTFNDYSAFETHIYKIGRDETTGKVNVAIDNTIVHEFNTVINYQDATGLALFGSVRSTQTGYVATQRGKIYSFKFWRTDKDDNYYLFKDLRPAIRIEDESVGFLDVVANVFYGFSSGYAGVYSGPTKNDRTFGMLVDISNLAVSSLTMTKERNQPDSVSVDIDYTQFKKKLEAEKTKAVDVIKPYLVDIVVRRNFKIIFAGVLMYSKVSLSNVHKQILTLQAIGYGDQFDKRYISQSYGDMSYPEIAQHIIEDGQHELNWIDNYYFKRNETQDVSGANMTGDDTSYFDGWYATDSSGESFIPVKYGDTSVTNAHWENGSINFPAGSKFTCFKLTCPDFVGHGISQSGYYANNDNQWVVIDFYVGCFGISSLSNVQLNFSFFIDVGNESYPQTITKTISISNVTPITIGMTHVKETVNFDGAKGHLQHILISNISGNNLAINDIVIYRANTETTRRNEINLASTVAYDLGLDVGYFDSSLTDITKYPKDRIRHYDHQNIKEAIYNLSKLENQNFEYYVDENGHYKLYEMQGNLVVNNVATWPGDIKEVAVERDASLLYNVGYAINEMNSSEDFNYTDRTSGAVVESTSAKKYKARVKTVSTDATNVTERIEDAQGIIYASDEVQNVPSLKFDSNIYNPGNVSVGDAFGINILTDETFSFINGEYRVYGYELTLTQDHVESITLTLVSPTALQLQLMTFPVTMKNILNDIKRLQIRTS